MKQVYMSLTYNERSKEYQIYQYYDLNISIFLLINCRNNTIRMKWVAPILLAKKEKFLKKEIRN